MESFADAVDDPADALSDEDASEFARLLKGLGLDDKQADVLAFLAGEGRARSAEIEEGCGLRQPQVSLATTALEARGWVESAREQTPGKGRPVNVYGIQPSLADVVEEVTSRKREEVNRELARMERLRSLVRDQLEAGEPEQLEELGEAGERSAATRDP